MIVLAVLSLVFGGVLLLLGAESLVRGAARLARLLNISPLVIGLTVVAYGTSAPEMAVSIYSNLMNEGSIAIGNVVGSNIFNVLVILGLSSLVAPLLVAQQLIRLDVPIMIGVSGLLFLFALDGKLQTTDGLVLFAGSIIYTVFLIYQSRRETNDEVQEEYLREYGDRPDQTPSWLVNGGFVLLGVVLLVVGVRLFVNGAIVIAAAIGISQLVIGLTVVALGTSLPELATSAVATLRGERDIAVGNVVGSNIFNILTVLGVAAIIASDGVAIPDAVIRFDLPVMLAVAVACIPIFWTGNVISRWEGVLFVGYYAAYASYLMMQAANHDKIGIFSQVMLLFVIPLTVITLLTVTVRTLGDGNSSTPSQSTLPDE